MHRQIYQNPTFRFGENHYLNACVGNNGSPNINTYQLGYYEAAITLIENAKKSPFNSDSIIYPIVFSARHAIELALKAQLPDLRTINARVNGKDFGAKPKPTHSIKELWGEYKELSRVDVRYTPYIENMEGYVRDFYDVDDSGETFRYPENLEEMRHLTELGCINIGVFGDRFQQMYEIVENLSYLTEFLSFEYREGTFLKGLSREQIEEIAKRLPHRENWKDDQFIVIRKMLMDEFGISSNTFTKTLNLIQNHREFASYIGMENSIAELDYTAMKRFLDLFTGYRTKFKTGDFVDVINDYANAVCDELSAANIYALAAIFDIAYFGLYTEAYERILEKKKKQDVFDLAFDDLSVARGIIPERMKIALGWLGQKTLLKAF
ncbi:MAG: hypothetical protein ACFFCW_04200 [Candidatus Hodarchaeota archaeon]